MSTIATRSHWMDWKPKARILADPAESEPTKPSKPGFVGFVGVTSADFPEIEALAVLNRAGIRIVSLEGGAAIGVWSDLDGTSIRRALEVVGMSRLPVLYLDGAGVPERYKMRRVAGEPVTLDVLAEMERREADPLKPEHPWKARDRMLSEMRWRSSNVRSKVGAK